MSQLSQVPHPLADNTERLKEVDEPSGLKTDDSSRSVAPSTSFQVDPFFSNSPTVFSSINPIAGLGVADDQYASMLSNMAGDLFSNSSTIGVKRPAQDADKDAFDGHPAKRGRFETIEWIVCVSAFHFEFFSSYLYNKLHVSFGTLTACLFTLLSLSSSVVLRDRRMTPICVL